MIHLVCDMTGAGPFINCDIKTWKLARLEKRFLVLDQFMLVCKLFVVYLCLMYGFHIP